nr:ABC transporter permease subunit [uncultured Devosia sp.]
MTFLDAIPLLGWGPDGWGPALLTATLTTLLLSLASFCLGSVIGMLVAAGKLFGGRIIGTLADAYGTVFRGVPDLLTIYFLYYGGSMAITEIGHRIGFEGFIGLPNFATGVIAIGIVSGAYQSEVFRGGYGAINRGELEAAQAFGMSPTLRLRRIVMPLVLRHALPGLANVWQLVLKDSALVSVIGLVELMRQTQVAVGSTRQPFVFYIAAAALYLSIALVSGLAFSRAERRTRRGLGRA